jgi:hypothetical protein
MDSATKEIQTLRYNADRLLEPAMNAVVKAVFEAALFSWMGKVSSDAQLHQFVAERAAGNADDLIAELWESPETAHTFNSVVGWVVQKMDAQFVVREQG